MTFTYAGTLTTDLDKIRFHLQDTTSGSGPKPSGGNFTDEELNGLLDIEGSWQRTVAAGFETLWAVWASYVDTKMGPRDEKLSQAAGQYEKRARFWRLQFGIASSGAATRFLTRVDGYSDDIAADEQ